MTQRCRLLNRAVGAAGLALLLLVGNSDNGLAQPLPPEVPSGLPDHVVAPATWIYVRWEQPPLSHRYAAQAHSFSIVSSIDGIVPHCVPAYGRGTYARWFAIPPGVAWGEGDWIRMRAWGEPDCTQAPDPNATPEDLISSNAYVLPEAEGGVLVLTTILCAWIISRSKRCTDG